MIQRRNFLEQTHVREYNKQKYQNPYFKKTSRLKPWMFLVVGILAGLFILSIPFVLAYAPIFKITNVTIEGLTTIPEAEIRGIVDDHLSKKRLTIFPRSSRWFFSEGALYEVMMSQEPLTELSVIQQGRAIHITLKEEVTFVVWASGDMYSLLDKEGRVTEVLDPATANVLRSREGKEPLTIPEGGKTEPRVLAPTIPIIRDKSNAEVIIGSERISEEKVHHVLAMDEKVRALSFTPLDYEIDQPTENWIRIVTPGPDVLFDLLRALEEQESALQTVLRAHPQESAAWEYIDVRFPENVFVK